MRILVVDDDPTIRLLLSGFLKNEQDEIFLFEDGESILNYFQNNSCDIIILDWVLPGLSGTEVCRKIRMMPNGRWPFILMITARNGPDDLEKILSAGADEYIPKPLGLANLKIRLNVARNHVISRVRYKEAEEMMSQLARQDPMTMLPNRLPFFDNLHAAFREYRENGLKFAVFFMDLNGFKKVNDFLGHMDGDKILLQVADRLSHCFRERQLKEGAKFGPLSLLARLAGDEFVVLLQGVSDTAEIMVVTNSIHGIFSEPFRHKALEIQLDCTVGIACPNHEMKEAHEMLRAADLAMSHAKEHRLETYVFESALAKKAQNRRELERSLVQSLSSSEMSLYYQPIMNATSGKLAGFEGLLRWQRNGNFIPPDTFIPIAEETGFISQLGFFVFEEGLRFMEKFHSAHPEVFLSLNVSPVQLEHSGFLEKLTEILKNHSIDPRKVHLEITEQVMLNIEEGIRFLNGLKEMGFRLCIDDFGTGYSSLRYLKDLPIEILKIDKSFTREIHKHPFHVSLTRTLIDLAAALHADVIAEGVEELNEVNFLSALGCDLMQGYYYSRPVPEAEALKMLEKPAIAPRIN